METLNSQEGLKVVVENPSLISAREMPDSFLKERVINYIESWKRTGLDVDPVEALSKIEKFNPDFIFLLANKDRTEIYSQLYTAPVKVPSIRDFTRRFGLYSLIENEAEELSPLNPNLLVCFSLNCPEGCRVRYDDGREMSLARATLTGLSAISDARRLGYSFMPNVPPNTPLIEHYVNTINDVKAHGPIDMHHSFGAILFGALENSRPEHKAAGGGNMLVLYPKNKHEAELFEDIKRKRSEDPSKINFVADGNAILFEDMLNFEL